MSRIRRVLMLVIVAVLGLIGLYVVGMAEEGNVLNLPNALPDGSTLASVKDVFTEVADEESAQQLWAHMPHVLGGTEHRYVLKKDGQVEAEWGIVVFEFENEQIALEDFQHLADEVAFVNKNPRFVRIEGAEDVPEIQEFLNSDLEYACLMNEIVIFPLSKYVIWVDDYRVVFQSNPDILLDPEYGASASKATSTAEALFQLMASQKVISTVRMSSEGEEVKASEFVVVDEHKVALVEAELARPPIKVGEETELLVTIHPQEGWVMPTSLFPSHPIPNPLLWNTKAGEVLIGYEENMAISPKLADHRLIYHFDSKSVEIHEIDCKGDILIGVAEDLLGLYSYVGYLPSIYIPAKTLEWALPSMIGDESSPPVSLYLKDNNPYDQHTTAWVAPKNGALEMPDRIGTGENVELVIPMTFEEPGVHKIHIYVNALFVNTEDILRLKYMYASTEFSLTVTVGTSAGPTEKALEWLRTKQNPSTGSWDYFGHESVGITALATLSFLNAGYDASDQTVKHGLDYIVSKYNSTEGWISAEDVKQSNDEVLVYDTALAVLPLIFARHVDYTPPPSSPNLQAVLKGAARYLVNQ